MTRLLIREATAEDAAIVARLFTEFNALLGADGLPDEEAFLPANVQVSAAQMAGRLERILGLEVVLLAEVDDDAAGFAALRLIPYVGQDAPYAELTQLFVREDFQRRGVGAALVGAAEARAIEAGVTCVHIITGAQNSDAQAFYRAQGYSSESVEFEKHFREPSHV
jgi:GNAT superfamily N-acetyltransferase